MRAAFARLMADAAHDYCVYVRTQPWNQERYRAYQAQTFSQASTACCGR